VPLDEVLRLSARELESKVIPMLKLSAA
jgi:hypothetical protein